MPNFSITVTEIGLGSMTLSWTAPTENTDGTPLTDLAGFNIYYGQSQGSYPNRIRIDNPSIDTYVVGNLLPNTYYAVATSFNTAGIESAYSNVAVKTVPSN
ncbi:MAG: fibronectin type III domain-containing protein [Gammaproteobacteria bacterium]|nr:fibronectin type III domain-containing protein [Gammaproteobacteria bacterium]